MLNYITDITEPSRNLPVISFPEAERGHDPFGQPFPLDKGNEGSGEELKSLLVEDTIN